MWQIGSVTTSKMQKWTCHTTEFEAKSTSDQLRIEEIRPTNKKYYHVYQAVRILKRLGPAHQVSEYLFTWTQTLKHDEISGFESKM